VWLRRLSQQVSYKVVKLCMISILCTSSVPQSTGEYWKLHL